MKILLLGATGRVGGLVLNYLLTDDKSKDRVELKCLVRIPSKLVLSEEEKKKVEVIQGDVMNLDDLKKSISGCDVVISLVGPKDLSKPDGFYEKQSSVLVKALEKGQRLLYLCGLGLLPLDGNQTGVDDKALYEEKGQIADWLIPICSDMHQAAKNIQKESSRVGFHYTIVCPPHIPDGVLRWLPMFGMTGYFKRTGKYRTARNKNIYDQFSPFHVISAEDLADFFCLSVFSPNDFQDCRVGIGY